LTSHRTLNLTRSPMGNSLDKESCVQRRPGAWTRIAERKGRRVGESAEVEIAVLGAEWVPVGTDLATVYSSLFGGRTMLGRLPLRRRWPQRYAPSG
jgi:hypothetical protein